MGILSEKIAPIKSIDDSLTGGKITTLSSQIRGEEWSELDVGQKRKILLQDFQKISKLFFDNSHPGYLYDLIKNGVFDIISEGGKTLQVKGEFFGNITLKNQIGEKQKYQVGIPQ